MNNKRYYKYFQVFYIIKGDAMTHESLQNIQFNVMYSNCPPTPLGPSYQYKYFFQDGGMLPILYI